MAGQVTDHRAMVVPLRPGLPTAHALRAGARIALPRDARVYQIVFLAVLLTFGVLARDFTLRPAQMLLAFAAGLVGLGLSVRIRSLARDTRSALAKPG